MPVGTAEFGGAFTWQPDGPGFVNLLVVDGRGASARSTVYLE
jgi:hypothetical protein